jgi:hypothetical protein
VFETAVDSARMDIDRNNACVLKLDFICLAPHRTTKAADHGSLLAADGFAVPILTPPSSPRIQFVTINQRLATFV